MARAVALIGVLAAAALLASGQTNLPSYSRLTTPDTTPTRTGMTTIQYSVPLTSGGGFAQFIGGTDADKNPLSTTTKVQFQGGSNYAISTVPTVFTPRRGSTMVAMSQMGADSSGFPLDDSKTYVIGGQDPVTGVPSMNLGIYDPLSDVWTATDSTVVTAGQAAPVGRTGAAAAYLSSCNMTDPVNPKPCIVMVGGQSASGLLNDVWALWLTESPKRWEMIFADTATPEAGRPTRRTQAVGAASTDGTTMYVYGGITATGATSDMYALAPAGFTDPVYPQELVNVAVGTQARQSTQLSYWGDRGPGAAVDGNLRTDFDASGYPFACTHTTDEASPWWRTMLNATINVDAVRISPRSDCCVDRSRQYQVYTSVSDPNNGPPPLSGLVGDPMPNLAAAPVLVLFSQPRPTLYLWVRLLNLGYNRALTLCEVEILVKKRWVWRQLSGIANVALNKPTSQQSYLTDWSGGDPSRAVDGRTTTDYNSAPASCTHTNGAPAGIPVWWQVDLGQVYTISQMRLWTRMDCCTARNTLWNIYVGNSKNNYIYDPMFARQLTANTANAATGIILNNQAKGRYVTVWRPNAAGGDQSIVTICELQVMAEKLVNQPSPVRDFSSVVFRGNLVIFGGRDANGFNVDSIRFWNLDSRSWTPAFTPLGSGPGARSFAGMSILDSTKLLLYGGTSAADVVSDMSILTFPTCPAIDTITGVQAYRCNAAGTACVFTCRAGFLDQNRGQAVVCREDGQVDGVLPPCLSTSVAAAPRNMLATILTTGAWPNQSATVTWTIPSPGQLGYYTTIRGFRVRARPAEFLETFENGFPDPGAWRQFNATTQSASFFYFKDASLVLDAGAGTDYWAWSMLEDIVNTGIVVQACCQVRNGFIIYRDWPQSDVDVNGEWAIETQISVSQMPSGSGMVMGLLDMGLNAGRGEAQFFWGYRYTDWGDAGTTLTLGFESLGGRTARIFPALSESVYLRLEKIRFSNTDRDIMGTSHGVLRAYYKYTSGAQWSRVFETITYRETIGTYYNATACGTARAPDCIDGPGMRWRNIRPYFYAKSWNNNLYARAIGNFKYLKIIQGLGSTTSPVTNFLAATVNTTTLTALARGVTYTIEVQVQTDAGWGLPATQVLTMPPLAVSAANIVWGSREAAFNRPSYQLSMYASEFAAKGNDGNWFNNFHTQCTYNGEWWAVDLGVDYAAVKHIQFRNRCAADWLARRFHHWAVYIGQDVTGPRTTNVMVDQSLWNNYTTIENGMHRWYNIPNVPVRTLWAATDAGVNRALVPYAFSTAAWTGDAAFCRASVPTPGYGRYLYIANGYGDCFHLMEVQVYTANNCPVRISYGPNRIITDGGKSCAAGGTFGRQCEAQCNQGANLMSGTTVVTCNGEAWTGGFAAAVVCGVPCPDIDPPPYTERVEHVIIDDDLIWGTMPTLRRLRFSSLNPVESPVGTAWSYTATGMQALGRLGVPVDPSMVYVIEKIRAMDVTSSFNFFVTFTTDDRAGLLFRVVDPKNFYRVYLDIPSGLHVAEAVVNGVPRTMGFARQALRADVPYSLGVTVSGYDFNITLNGRLLMQVADRQFPQGYVGFFAQTTGLFTRAKFTRYTRACLGVNEFETCNVVCQAGLTSQGSPLSRTCNANGIWSILPTTPSKCTLDPPTFPSAVLAVNENSARNALVGAPLVAQSSSPGYPVQYQMMQVFAGSQRNAIGTDLFSVDFCSGQVKVRQSNSLDFESTPQYLLQVRAYIAGFTDAFTDRNITVNLIDVDESPVVVSTVIEVPELTATGTIVGYVTWWDPENDTVAHSIDVDGSLGKFSLTASTGAFVVTALPSNSSGFSSMGTGSNAPLNMETQPSWEISVTAVQTTCLRRACGASTPLTGTGAVLLKPQDENDPPYFGNTLQVLRVDQLVTVNNGAVVGTPSVIDEDQGKFMAPPTFAQVDPALCGLTVNTKWPTNTFPPAPPLTIGTNNLFAVDPATGQITIARQPARAYNANNGVDDDWAPFVSNGVLARAVYQVCIRATDGNDTSLTTTAPVEVVVRADIPNLPKADGIMPNTFPTNTNTTVNVTGQNFVIGNAVRAFYGNGVNWYNATGCSVLTTTLIQCRTVVGVGGNMRWTVFHNNKVLLSETDLIASYMAPTVTLVTGHTGMSTAGSAVTITGANFGPQNSAQTPNFVTVVFGTAYEIPCTVTAQGQTSITCRSSGEHGGRQLPYKIIIGGQEATTADLWSYAAPTVISITVVDPQRLLNTAGGTVINVNGTNFGGITVNSLRGLVTTFGTLSGTLLDLPCTKPVSTQPHTYMTCTVPAGAGVRHAISISVFGVAMAAPFGTLAYYPPVITSMFGPGFSNADTAGGQMITIVGRHFGPQCFARSGSACTVMLQPNGVTYGSDGDTYGRYTAASCTVTSQQADATGAIQCLSFEGVGKNIRYTLTLGEQLINNTGGVFPEVGSSHKLGSYAAPNIAAFAGAGSYDANTRGGESVVISGRNFGPADAYTNGLLSVSYGVELQDKIKNGTNTIIANVTYKAASCAITKPHVEITCATAEGAGSQLAWDIVLAAQKSATPTTSYAAPIIDAITYENMNPVTDANVDGGEWVVLTGDFFGPTVYAATLRSLVQSVTYGPYGTEYVVPESDWLVVSHSQIKARLQPGSGENLVFRLMIADQVSTSRPGATFSYAKPLIVDILPEVAGTYSDDKAPTIITVKALNLPLRDPRSRVAILFANANERLITPVVPQGPAAIARARNADDGSINITFNLPTHGGGLYQQVRIAILPSTSNVPSQRSLLTPFTTISYNDPVIRDIVVTKARFSDNNTVGQDLPACPFKTGPPPWTCDDPDLYQLTLEGSDFSSDASDMTVRVIERYFLLGDGSTLWSAASLWRVSWDHSRIVAYTLLRGQKSGNLRLNITSLSWDKATVLSQTVSRNFSELSPDISAISGADAPFPTTGGTTANLLSVVVENLDNARGLSVTVGGRAATLYSRSGTGPYTYTPITDTRAWAAASKDLATNTWTLYVQVPPGQGKKQTVQVFKQTADGVQGSNTQFFVTYIPPVLAEVAVVKNNVEVTRVRAEQSGTITVPTDGVTARVRMYGTNLGVDPAIIAGDGFRVTGADVVPCTVTPAPAAHTCYEFVAVPGEGDGSQHRKPDGDAEYPLFYRLLLEAGDQATGSMAWKYEAPVVTAVVSNTTTYPTRGGVPLEIRGRNFGVTKLGRPLIPIIVKFGRTGDAPSEWTQCTATRLSHTVMTCTLPEGSGRALAVDVTVATLSGVSPNVFSYDKPTISGVAVYTIVNGSYVPINSTAHPSVTNPIARGSTSGGDLLVLTGSNFGSNRPGMHCAFFSWSFRSGDASRVPTCNNQEDYLGEGEIPAANVVQWDHESVRLYTPAGIGVKDIELSIRGRTTEIPLGNAALRRFMYSAPVLSGFWLGQSSTQEGEPQGKFDTDGGETVTAWGANFGPTPIANSSFSSDRFSPDTVVPLSVAPSLPTAVVGIVFHRACISNARTLFGARPNVPIPIKTAGGGLLSQNIENCGATVARHEHGRLVFQTGAGIGRNRTAYVVVIDGPITLYSNDVFVDYYAPRIDSFQPNTVYMTGELQLTDVYGKYFGNAELADVQGWNAEERAVDVVVGGFTESCVEVRRRREAGETIVSCNLNEAIMPAGYRNVSLTVAGQNGRKEADALRALLLVCANGFYGRVNETCLPCPAQSDDPARRGAVCKGYIRDATPFEERFSYPRPLKGWYNLNSSDMYTRRVETNPSMLSACPEGFQDNGRDVCIVPCDPPESCLGDNHCAEGYTSKPPMWRCAYCDKGFYKRAGECIKCPDSPAALFIGFILLVIVVASVGFALNRKQINIAVISIGVDFFQVLAIFAQARIKWPPVVKELLHVLSAFNLNIEIVAPECLVPDISYKQKFWFIMILPLCIMGIFGCSYVSILFYRAVIQGQPKKTWHTHRPALMSSGLVLLYLLYLYLTRTIFDVFNCGPLIPSDGHTYLQVVFERCGVPGGTQMTLIPYAVAGLVVYTAGYPLTIGYTIFQNREIVMEDQLLRAKGTGNDKLTNPRAYDFRLTFGRSYFQFKPDWCLWILAIILRKFFIAITAVVFGKNSSFQMAACLLIMFLAYAAQVQIRPYMSPGDFEEVLKSHAEASYTSAIHARLRASLAGIESRGRKKAHKNLINFEGKVDRTAVLGLLTGFFFNYNTVEAIMTFCAVIVCLMAIMYQANELNSYYPESKDSVTSVVLIVVIWAIVYFFTVFMTEVVVLYNEDTRAKQLAKAARMSRGKDGKKAAGEDEDTKARRANAALGSDGEFNAGTVEQATNPMFVNQQGSTNMSTSDVASTIMSQRESPPTEMWRVFQSSYLELNDQVKSLQDQLLAAKKAAQTGMGMSDEVTSARTARTTSRTEFAPKSSGGDGQVNPLLKGGASGKGMNLAAARKSATRSPKVTSEE